MRVALFGSCGSRHEVEPFANEELFDSVCAKLGEGLGSASARHTLIVESDEKRTADARVVAGIRRLDAGSRGGVEAWYRTGKKASGNPVHEPYAGDSWVIKVPVPVAHIGPAHMRMLQKVDLAIVIGGGNNAYLAGQAARAMTRRFCPPDCSGQSRFCRPPRLHKIYRNLL